MPSSDALDPRVDPRVAAVLAYHERSKHGYARPARSLGYLDWDNQPDPFRRYDGAELVSLLLPAEGGGPSYEQLFHPGSVEPRALDGAAVSEWLYHSLALSAWKRHGTSRWPLRVNPSSGNLHPTEGYLALPAVADLADAPALYHYAPKEHGLERRAVFEAADGESLFEGLPEGCFLVALSSIPWRESWKYGERAWRYCQHDVGHALAALRLSAALLGWRLTTMPDVADENLAQLLGLDRTDDFEPEEPEHPDLLAVVETAPSPTGASVPASWVPGAAATRAARWAGRANRLSAEHVAWSVIDEVGRASARDETTASIARARPAPSAPLPLDESDDVPAARQVLRQRRSAVAMDGRTGMTRQGFFDLLARVLPERSAVPWDALSWPTAIHLGLFVHRVADVPPGLYLLTRDAQALEPLRAAMRSDFDWQRPEGCPEALPLVRLTEADVRSPAESLSCGQEIAAEGVFSLAMLAEHEGTLRRHGASAYRMLYWEAGAIGQVLYVEAEALGLRATGIGCFFDDPVHSTFGLSGRDWQSLYHFTVGGAVDDERLATEPAYPARPG